MFAPRCDQHVHVIWHDTPGMDVIPFPREEQQRILNQLCDIRFTKHAAPEVLVQRSLDSKGI